MAQTKMIARIVAGQRREAARATAAANKPGPSNQRREDNPDKELVLKTLKEEFVVEILK